MTEVIGNGKIIAEFSGVDVECVRGVGISAPLLCSLYAENAHTFSVKSKNECSLICREITPPDGKGKIWISDFCDEENPVFVRKVEVVSSLLTYFIKTPPSAKIYYPIPTAALICDGEFCVCISLSGNARFVGDKIEFACGDSYTSFVAARMSELPSLADNRISPEVIFKKAKTRTNTRFDGALLRYVALQSEGGGVFRDAANDEIYILEQENAVREFLSGGIYDRAKRAVEFILSVYLKNSFMPYSVNCKGEAKQTSAHSSALLPSVAAICAYEYFKKTNDADFIADNLKTIAKITISQCDGLICSHMPFCGKEKVFDGALPIIAVEYGSLLSDISFIDSAKALLYLSEVTGVTFAGKARLSKWLEACENSLSDYKFGGKTFVNCKNRFMRARKPEVLFCRCEYCSAASVNDREQFCFLDFHRRYVCLSCFGKEPPDNIAALHEIETDGKSRSEILKELVK